MISASQRLRTPEFRIESRNRATFIEWSKCDDMYLIVQIQKGDIFGAQIVFRVAYHAQFWGETTWNNPERKGEKEQPSCVHVGNSETHMYVCIYIYIIFIYIYMISIYIYIQLYDILWYIYIHIIVRWYIYVYIYTTRIGKNGNLNSSLHGQMGTRTYKGPLVICPLFPLPMMFTLGKQNDDELSSGLRIIYNKSKYIHTLSYIYIYCYILYNIYICKI